MIFNKVPFAILILLSLFFSSCRLKKIKKKEINLEIPQVVELVKIDSAALIPIETPKVFFKTEQLNFDKIKIKSKIDIKSSKFSQSIPVNINIRKDSLIWISVSMGLEAARAIITPDSMFMIDRLNKDYYKLSFAEVSKQFEFDINFSMIQALMVGNMPITIDSSDVFQNSPEYNIIIQNRKSVEIRNRFDLVMNKLFSILGQDKKTKTNLTVLYKSFINSDGYIVPRETNIVFDNNSIDDPKKVKIDIEHYKFDFLDRNIRFPFSVPKGYTEKKIPAF